MALQLSVAVRNARLDAIETVVGTAPVIKYFTGAPPANCAAANQGTELRSFSLPSDWLAAAASGSKAKSGTWSDSSVGTAGTIGHFRIYASDGTTCGMQGTVTATGGGGDMTVDNVVIAVSQLLTITGFSLTDANA